MSEYKFWVVKDGQLHLFRNPHQDFEPMCNDIEWGELLDIHFHDDETTTWKEGEEEEEEDDDDDLAKYDKYMEYEFPQRMEDNPTKIRNIIRDYFNGLRSINDLFWDGGQVKEWGDEDLMNYVQDRLIDERWEEEEEKCSTCGKRLNDAELIEDICGPGCDEYDKGLLETREYPTIEEILSKMKELKEDENEWDDDTIYDAICEWDDKFADDPNWFDEEDTDVKDSLRDRVCIHLGLGEFKKEEDCECGGEYEECTVCEDKYKCSHCGLCECQKEEKE